MKQGPAAQLDRWQFSALHVFMERAARNPEQLQNLFGRKQRAPCNLGTHSRRHFLIASLGRSGQRNVAFHGPTLPDLARRSGDTE